MSFTRNWFIFLLLFCGLLVLVLKGVMAHGTEPSPSLEQTGSDDLAEALASLEMGARPRDVAVLRLDDQDTRDEIVCAYPEAVNDINVIYPEVVLQIIRQGWTFSGIGESLGLSVVIRVTLSLSGEVAGVRIEESSGRADFDASVLAAVQRANGQLPPPPDSSLQDLRLVFNVDSLENESKDALPRDNEPITLNLHGNGVLYLEGREMSDEDLEIWLAARVNEQNSQFLLKIDETVSYGRVLAVMNRFKAAGIEKLGLVVETIKDSQAQRPPAGTHQ